MSPLYSRYYFYFLFLSWLLIASGTHYLFFIGAIDEASVVSKDYTPSGIFKLLVPSIIVLSILPFFVLFFNIFLVKVTSLVFFVFFVSLSVIGLFSAEYFYFFIREFVLIVSLVLAVFSFSIYTNRQDVLGFLFFSSFCIVAASYVTVFLLPNYGVSVGVHEGRWQGIFSHKNQLGAFCVFSLLFCCHRYLLYRERCSLLLLFLTSYLLFRSESYLAYGLSIFVFFGFSCYLFGFKRVANIAAVVFIFAVFSVFILTLAFDYRVEILGKEGFNNRDLIWGYYFQAASDHPFFGHGIGQIQAWSRDNKKEIMDALGSSYPVGSAHNGFIDLYFSSGIFGILLALVFFGVFLSKFVVSKSDKFLQYSFLTVFLVLNLFESRLLGLQLPAVYMLLVYTYFNKVPERFEMQFKKGHQ